MSANHYANHPSSFGLNRQKKRASSKLWLRFLIAGTLALGGWQVLSSGYLLAKAHLSQWLIADAWALTLKDGEPHKPWSWADTYPVAKMTVPSLSQSSFILSGANARNMAFGAAHLYQSGMPGEAKTTVFSGHNDSHFSYLANIKQGDEIQVETKQGLFRYQVTDLRIIDQRKKQINIRNKDQLVLTTCYPFHALTSGGPLRFQVTAERR